MKYIVEVIADNSGQWVGNSLIFETKKAAETWGFGLAMR